MAEHRIVVPSVVGSSPITHPIKNESSLSYSHFLWSGWDSKGGSENSPVDCFPAVGESHGPKAHPCFKFQFIGEMERAARASLVQREVGKIYDFGRRD